MTRTQEEARTDHATDHPARHRRTGEFELYDLARDVSETSDLAETHPGKLATLTARWEQVDAEMVDPVWTPNRR